MVISQFQNLSAFSILFLSQSSVSNNYKYGGIFNNTPEYIMSKYDILVNTPIEKRDVKYGKNFLKFFDQYLARWNFDEVEYDYKFKNVLYYLYTIHNVGVHPKNIIKLFKLYIGDVDLITNDKDSIRCLHENLRSQLIYPYIKRHSETRYLKLLFLDIA